MIRSKALYEPPFGWCKGGEQDAAFVSSATSVIVSFLDCGQLFGYPNSFSIRTDGLFETYP
jgi:hypothetical protein